MTESEAPIHRRLADLNSSGLEKLRRTFKAVAHSTKWINQMCLSTPFSSVEDLQAKGATAWSYCDDVDWMEALQGHPRIGERQAGSDLAAAWSRGEQSDAAHSDEAVKSELRQIQLAYEKRFGYLFLICATGLSSADILAALEQRMQNSHADELKTVAQELGKIIHLRLEKLLES